MSLKRDAFIAIQYWTTNIISLLEHLITQYIVKQLSDVYKFMTHHLSHNDLSTDRTNNIQSITEVYWINVLI